MAGNTCVRNTNSMPNAGPSSVTSKESTQIVEKGAGALIKSDQCIELGQLGQHSEQSKYVILFKIVV